MWGDWSLTHEPISVRFIYPTVIVYIHNIRIPYWIWDDHSPCSDISSCHMWLLQLLGCGTVMPHFDATKMLGGHLFRVWVHRGFILSSYMGIILNHKDPYQTTSTLESKRFFRGSHDFSFPKRTFPSQVCGLWSELPPTGQRRDFLHKRVIFFLLILHWSMIHQAFQVPKMEVLTHIWLVYGKIPTTPK